MAVKVCQVLTTGLLGNSLSFFFSLSFFLKFHLGDFPGGLVVGTSPFSVVRFLVEEPHASWPKSKAEHRSNIAANSIKN